MISVFNNANVITRYVREGLLNGIGRIMRNYVSVRKLNGKQEKVY